MTSFTLFGHKFAIDNDMVKYIAIGMFLFYAARIVKFFIEKIWPSTQQKKLAPPKKEEKAESEKKAE